LKTILYLGVNSLISLIKSCADLAVECAFRGEAGVIGHDDDQNFVLRAIEFPRIKGGKPFDIDTAWFTKTLTELGQEKGKKLETSH
jgi:pyrophosphate--fructose-6-phosphate 1-phosphotransferase